MDTTAAEATVSAMKMEQGDEIEKDAKIEEIQSDVAIDEHGTQENQQQQRQDFNSDTYKIEILNMGKFAFGVCKQFKFRKINLELIEFLLFFLLLPNRNFVALSKS